MPSAHSRNERWNKYPSSTKYNPQVAAIVNQAKKPLVIISILVARPTWWRVVCGPRAVGECGIINRDSIVPIQPETRSLAEATTSQEKYCLSAICWSRKHNFCWQLHPSKLKFLTVLAMYFSTELQKHCNLNYKKCKNIKSYQFTNRAMSGFGL